MIRSLPYLILIILDLLTLNIHKFLTVVAIQVILVLTR
jgi:hypothetical protein